jgi:hypothetical protein
MVPFAHPEARDHPLRSFLYRRFGEKNMPDENLEKEEQSREFYKMKADAFDLRVTLDRLTAQGNQLADVYNKMCAEIQKKEQEINNQEKGKNVNSSELPR